MRTRELAEEDIVALYMNNRAAEEPVAGRHAKAYWWARAALLGRPSSLAACNTLVSSTSAAGARCWPNASTAPLERAPDSLIVMQNLAPLLAANGKQAEADA